MLIRSVASYGLLFDRYDSCIGHNALFFSHRYCCTIQDIIDGRTNSIVGSYCDNLVDENCSSVAGWLYDLLMIRDNVFEFSSGFTLPNSDLILIDIIVNFCTY